METVASMVVGVLAGMTVFPARWAKANARATLLATVALIFAMGVTLGGRDGFVDEIGQVGLLSVAFCLIPTALSTLVVFLLTTRFMKGHVRAASTDAESARADAEASSGEGVMIAAAVGALACGILYGLAPLPVTPLDLLAERSDIVLYALMLSVGISVGMAKGTFERIRTYRAKVLVIPFGTVVGTLVGGAVCALAFGMNPAVGSAVAGGLGWYSLSGVMMTELAGAQVGSITFLSNLLREIVSFFSIPWIARHLNFPTCIAPAGATSEDTTLPMLIRCTDEETVVLSVVNGVLCSAMVPVVIGCLSRFF